VVTASVTGAVSGGSGTGGRSGAGLGAGTSLGISCGPAWGTGWGTNAGTSCGATLGSILSSTGTMLWPFKVIGSTLRSGSDCGVDTLRGGAGSSSGASTGLVTGISPVTDSDRSFRAVTWLSVSGLRGEPGVGFWRASRISWMPARIRSFEEAIGMLTFVGNQEIVSQTRIERVSQIHAL
jgi:hypothetical protein